MRIIAGEFKGRKIKVPKGLTVRPTSDRVREAIFSIIGERVRDRSVLDLFAGSGALGIEALSRGASKATFIDSSQTAISLLQSNLSSIGLYERDPSTAQQAVEVLRISALAFLQNATRRHQYYDLVFLDPPYKLASRIGHELSAPLWDVLNPGALVICESDRREPLDLNQPIHDQRRYGDTIIRIYVSE